MDRQNNKGTVSQGRTLSQRIVSCLLVFVSCCLSATAQQFFTLSDAELQIDSVLPVFRCEFPIGRSFADSAYSVSIEYPDLVPMTDAEAARYRALTDMLPGELPAVSRMVSVDRKEGTLHVSFVPIVMRDGRLQKLTGFMVRKTASLLPRASRLFAAGPRQAAATGRYAESSVLSSGQWAKIRIPSTGIYQLTESLVQQAGFSSLDRVKIYGYGGGMQPERLTPDYLAETDDLHEVATCKVGSVRLFYGIGPVTWNSNNQRVRNPYSQYGYYFLTESDEQPLTVSEADFLAASYPLADHYNSLYEVDDYAWFSGGRNLYDAQPLEPGSSRMYTLAAAGNPSAGGTLTVAVSADKASTVSVYLNGQQLMTSSNSAATISISSPGSYDKMRTNQRTFNVSDLQASNTITLTTTTGSGTVRLDYISLHCNQPCATPSLQTAHPTPEFVYRITNQNHHADPQADMVIIIPTTQKLLSQAMQLKTLHEQLDGMRVNIVPADELYNEFSSGTPDANAYRRYMKMLYDRADSEADMPRFLLLLGDGAWDNRMLSGAWQGNSPNDFLLCYESENSYSEVDCYVSDDYFCLLDDNEGGSMLTSDKADAAVGRISARTAEEAQMVVDKVKAYVQNTNAGAWQNSICFLGDDGNQNQHMQDADSVAQMVEQLFPELLVKRIMWDAYTRVSSSTGNSYPDVERLIKQVMQQGVLLMNYSGHGSTDAISHEYVLKLKDFESFTSPRLPLWLTASCDIMPFDGQTENIGETAMMGTKGGAIAFYGTTRTVYQNYNHLMNIAYTRHVLSNDATGRPTPIGEAVRQAKNELITTGIITGYNNDGTPKYSFDTSANKLQYSLLGDPALRLAKPTMRVVIDSINGTDASAAASFQLSAGSTATLKGHVEHTDGTPLTDYHGTLTGTVRDAEQLIVCKLNDMSSDMGASEAFTFYDRPSTIFSGSDSVRAGKFKLTFVVPKDIDYSDNTGIINLYTVNDQRTLMGNGTFSNFYMQGTADVGTGGSGPSLFCYLNNSSFANGDNVNRTPFFVAEVADEDGINASGNGIGHDLQIIIDGKETTTYSLNDYFQYDFGSYTRGTIGFSIPELDYGQHTLLFRAWDVLNNSSSVEMTFNVVNGLEPVIVDVACTKNPATTSTTFRIVHDRRGSELSVILDVFDTSGRQLWQHTESGTSVDNTYSIDWDLTGDGGTRLKTGLYLYRIRLSCDGSTFTSKSKKLIIL